MAENTPSSFSASRASAKSKRHSLNIISPGPRPLHLASGSLLSSPPRSPSRSQALPNSIADSPVSGTSHYFNGPLSPLGLGASRVKHGRRQSSISYVSSNRDRDRPTTLLSPSSPTEISKGKASMSSNSATAAVEEGSRMTISGTRVITLDALKQLKERPPATLAEKYVA